MRAAFVVIQQPVVGSLLHLAERVEQVGVEHLVAEALVKSLDERVLVRLAGLDVQQPDAVQPGPVGESVSRHFGAVVNAE